MPDSASAAVVEPAATAPVVQPRPKPRPQPRYHVILWNDDEHSYQYVIAMLRQVFGHPHERGFTLAKEVDRTGRAIVLTTNREHAELKRDQILAFGADRLVARCKGSMQASIEAED